MEIMTNTTNESMHIRLAYATFPPARMACAWETNLRITQTCQYPGWHSEQIVTLLDAAGITYSLVPVNDSLIEEHGFVNAVYHMINMGMVDSAAMFFATNTYRLENFRVSYPIIGNARIGAISVPPSSMMFHATNIFNFLSIIDERVWFALALVLVLVKCNSLMLKGCRAQTGSFVEQTADGAAVFAEKLSSGMAFVVLGLFMSLYSNVILSQLLMPTSTTRFNDLPGLIHLVDTGELRIIAPKNTGWLQTVKDGRAQNEDYARLLDALEHNPLVTMESLGGLDKAIDSLNRTGDIIMYDDMTARFATKRVCRGELVQFEQFHETGDMLLFAKTADEKLISRIDAAILQHFPVLVSVVQRYHGKFARKDPRCVLQVEPAVFQRITIQKITGVLFVCVAGGVIGLGVFGLEFLLLVKTVQIVKT